MALSDRLAFAALAARRVISPGQRRSVIVIPQARLAYFRVPKAANSSVKDALFNMLPEESRPPVPAGYGRHRTRGMNKDSFWTDADDHGLRMLSPAEFVRERTGYLSFTVVRNPFARLVSAYFDKVRLRRRVFGPFATYGFTADMDFTAFAERVASIPDAIADVHFRSQTTFVTAGGAVVPDHVGRVETLEADWAALAARLAEAGGPDLPPLKRLVRTNTRRPTTAAVLAENPGAVGAILERYRGDFDAFYPDRRIPES